MSCICGHDHIAACRECECDQFNTVDDLADGIDELINERNLLKTRVAALESQLATAPDPVAHEVYRAAAVLVSAHVAAARGSSDEVMRQRVLAMFGGIAARVDPYLTKEQQ